MGGGGGRAPCCDKTKVKRGPWSPAEDVRLVSFIQKHGHPNWRSLPKQAGLLRCGKSCRLRWINYLRPDLKRGNFTPQEEHSIIRLHATYGNKWSKIASHLPGRTDNEIKNVWNTHLKKRSLVMNTTNDTNKNQRDVANISNGQEISEGAMLIEADTIIDQPSTPSSTISCNSDQDNYGKACCSWDTPPCDHYETIKINNHEIPLESEVEFWNMLESQPISDNHDHDHQGVGFPQNKPCKDQDMELEYWVRLLEEELGLVSPSTADIRQVDRKDHEQITKNNKQDVHEMWCKTISDQISPFWPTSPVNNGFF